MFILGQAKEQNADILSNGEVQLKDSIIRWVKNTPGNMCQLHEPGENQKPNGLAGETAELCREGQDETLNGDRSEEVRRLRHRPHHHCRRRARTRLITRKWSAMGERGGLGDRPRRQGTRRNQQLSG